MVNIGSKALDILRKDTPGCSQRIHLNNAGAALMPKPVISAIKSHIDLEAQIGGYESADQQADEIDQFYYQAARFFGGVPTNYAFVANATDAYSRALSSIPFSPGDVILTSLNDYISNQIAFLSLKKRFGIEVQYLANTTDGLIDVEAAKNRIAQDPPKLVAISHVPTNSGIIQPVESIGQICKRHNILYLVDACQSMGQIEVDVNKIRCDFLSGTFRKFLRGPRVAGILYVSDRILKDGYEPLFIDMRGAIWTGPDVYNQLGSAKRFEDWEFSYALLLGSREALKYANKIGIAAISERAVGLANIIREQLKDESKIRILDQNVPLGAIITMEVQGITQTDLGQYLAKHRVNHSFSTYDNAVLHFEEKKVDWALRVAPHYYNNEDEISTFCDLIKNLAL